MATPPMTVALQNGYDLGIRAKRTKDVKGRASMKLNSNGTVMMPEISCYKRVTHCAEDYTILTGVKGSSNHQENAIWQCHR